MRLLLVRDCSQSGDVCVMPVEFLEPAHKALRAAAESFLADGRSGYLPQIVSGLNSTLRATRVASCDLLVSFGAAASVAVPRLLEIAGGTHEQERMSALTALIAIGRGDVSEVEYARKLLGLLNEEAGLGPLPLVVRAFRHVNDQTALKNLFALCRDPEIDYDTNAEALLLYEEKFPGAATRWVIDTIRSEPAGEMSGAYENAVQLAKPDSPLELVEVLEEKLRDPQLEGHNRRFALDAMSKLGERGRQVLLDLDPGDQEVQSECISALARNETGFDDALRLLRVVLDLLPSASFVLEALKTVAEMDAKRDQVSPFLAERVRGDDDTYVAKLCLSYLGGLWCNQSSVPDYVFEAFDRALGSKRNALLREEALSQLTRLRGIPARFVGAALKWIPDPRKAGEVVANPMRYPQAFEILQRMGEGAADARPVLLALVQTHKQVPETVRALAAQTLGGFAELDERALEALEDMAYEQHPGFRLAGARGLALRTQDPERSLQAFLVLEDLCADQNAEVRRQAYELCVEAALAILERRAKALPMLAALAREPIVLGTPFDERDINQGLARDGMWGTFATRRSWAVAQLLRFGDEGEALVRQIFAEDETLTPVAV